MLLTSPSASFKREGRVRGSVVVLARVECANELRGTGQELLPTDPLPKKRGDL